MHEGGPGREAEGRKKPRAKDVFGRTLPTEEEFPALKDAPKYVLYVCVFSYHKITSLHNSEGLLGHIIFSKWWTGRKFIEGFSY